MPIETGKKVVRAAKRVKDAWLGGGLAKEIKR